MREQGEERARIEDDESNHKIPGNSRQDEGQIEKRPRDTKTRQMSARPRR